LKAYRQELIVYVVWHPDFAAGRTLAAYIYDHLTRVSGNSLARGLGIPVYLRTATNKPSVPDAIPVDDAVHTVAVLLVDITTQLNQMRLMRPCSLGSAKTMY
jgi:hypothetical protein